MELRTWRRRMVSSPVRFRGAARTRKVCAVRKEMMSETEEPASVVDELVYLSGLPVHVVVSYVEMLGTVSVDEVEYPGDIGDGVHVDWSHREPNPFTGQRAHGQDLERAAAEVVIDMWRAGCDGDEPWWPHIDAGSVWADMGAEGYYCDDVAGVVWSPFVS